MKARLISSIAVACCVVYPWQWVVAEAEFKYPSPNGKFALRIKDASVELVQKATGEVIVDLGTASRSQVLVWSPDSK